MLLGSFITLYLGYIGRDCVISESYYKGTIVQRNYRKMTFNFFVTFHCKHKHGSHNMTICPNPCYNKVSYKGAAQY